MGVITTLTVLKLSVKLLIFIGGVLAVAGALNWMHNKKFNKKAGAHNEDQLADGIKISR